MEKIKVFLCDPQILFREGIHFTLSGEEDFEVTGEATDNGEALTAIEANPPHVVILSMKDGKVDGPEATRRIRRNLPSVSVALVADSDSEDQFFQALKSGANACLTKDVTPDFLVNIVKEIARGGHPVVKVLLAPGLAAKVLADFESLGALGEQLNSVLAHLSPKETDVLKRIAEGTPTEQIASKLSVSEEAIRHQLELVAQKLVANEQTRAMLEVVQKSLPSLFAGTIQGRPATEYITKAEFAEFKEGLMQSLKSLVGELTPPDKH